MRHGRRDGRSGTARRAIGLPRAGGLLALALALGLAAPALPASAEGSALRAAVTGDVRMALRPRSTLWDWVAPELRDDLAHSLEAQGLGHALQRGELAVALVDVTRVDRPRVAEINGDRMFYAASLPKIAIMLAVFQKAAEGRLSIDAETRAQLARMIHRSSNADSTALMHKVGKPYIADVLLSPRYRLYDPDRNGGLWVGKDYASAGLWRRDPVANLSHAATAMQVARFYYLLQKGLLVTPQASGEMKALLGETDIHHKFVAGLEAVRPSAAVYRKSGTWRNFHADGALVERRDGSSYIAVALSTRAEGRDWFPRIIIAMDRLIGPGLAPVGTAAAQ